MQAIEFSEPGDTGEEDGVFYPIGGWGTIRDALLQACKQNGVNLRFGTKASAIVVEDGACVGVDCQQMDGMSDWGPDGEPPGVAAGTSSGGPYRLDADSVICNADLATAEALLPASARRSAYRERSESTQVNEVSGDWREWRFSSSTVTFLFGLDHCYDQLTHHNVFIGEEEAWEGLFDAVAFEEWGRR